MGQYAFPRQCRLLQAGDYRVVFNKADIRVSHRHFLILATDTGLSHPRVGLVFSKKNLKLSVQRNRIKRLVRETFRVQQSTLPELDIVVLGRRGLDTLDNRDVILILDRLWQRLCQEAKRRQAAKSDVQTTQRQD
ncbi:ribonuclease P protein component [Mangrovitalea sediminis]|uniref:ribonuclease P protein component n=1 Tax=Mangrovitalea sediminis TaxID=1982043 RepID=UPI000BE4E69F|nr:ribonuclease P protein component [Mangrovitalea sediminis]